MSFSSFENCFSLPAPVDTSEIAIRIKKLFIIGTYIAGKSSLTDSRLESICLGRRTLRLPMKPPTRLRRESPEMAGLRPEMAGLRSEVDGPLPVLGERWRNAAVSWWSGAFISGWCRIRVGYIQRFDTLIQPFGYKRSINHELKCLKNHNAFA